MFFKVKQRFKQEKESELKLIKEKAEEDSNRVRDKYNKVLRLLQELCPHEHTHVITDFDYHKGETWHETYCTDCEKLLKRV